MKHYVFTCFDLLRLRVIRPAQRCKNGYWYSKNRMARNSVGLRYWRIKLYDRKEAGRRSELLYRKTRLRTRAKNQNSMEHLDRSDPRRSALKDIEDRIRPDWIVASVSYVVSGLVRFTSVRPNWRSAEVSSTRQVPRLARSLRLQFPPTNSTHLPHTSTLSRWTCNLDGIIDEKYQISTWTRFALPLSAAAAVVKRRNADDDDDDDNNCK